MRLANKSNPNIFGDLKSAASVKVSALAHSSCYEVLLMGFYKLGHLRALPKKTNLDSRESLITCFTVQYTFV